MKTLKYIFIGVIICIIGSSCGTQSNKSSNKQQIITLQSQCNTFPKELLTESSTIITKRLNCLNVKDFTIEENIDQAQLIVKFNEKVDIQYLSEILPIRGKVNFLETFKRDDVLKYLQKAAGFNCVKNIDSLLGLKDKSNHIPDAVFGHAEIKDTSTINGCLKSAIVRSFLPSNLRFFWSRHTTETNKLQLYAISVDNMRINETTLQDADISKVVKSFTVTMTFKKEFWSIWEDLTKRNMDKAIAFVVDERVYSAPVVRSIITGGKVQITGNFSEKEANNLVSIISGGQLPLDFMIK